MKKIFFQLFAVFALGCASFTSQAQSPYFWSGGQKHYLTATTSEVFIRLAEGVDRQQFITANQLNTNTTEVQLLVENHHLIVRDFTPPH